MKRLDANLKIPNTANSAPGITRTSRSSKRFCVASMMRGLMRRARFAILACGAALSVASAASAGTGAPPLPPAFLWKFASSPTVPGRALVTLTIRCGWNVDDAPVWVDVKRKPDAVSALRGIARDVRAGRYGFREQFDPCTAAQRNALENAVRHILRQRHDLA
jgi:hypothetical protein